MASDRRKILRAIQRESRQIKDPKARRVFRKMGVEIGLSESNLTNPSGGDADSGGWRQERRSLYADPTNINHATRRLREEFQQYYDPGEKSYDVAVQVQRPAAQYAGRFKERAGEAERILRDEVGGAPYRREGASYTTKTTPGVDNGPLRQQAKLSYLQDSHDPDALLNLGLSLRGSQDTPGKTVKTKIKGPSGVAGTKTALASAAKQEADAIDSKQYDYQWGGGHNPGGKPTHGTGHGSGSGVGFDCSGAVSKVLGIDARVSGEFAKWGKAGRAKGGRGITVYSNNTHVLMEIDGHFFGTSSSNPGGGAGWIKRKDLPAGYLKKFTARHA